MTPTNSTNVHVYHLEGSLSPTTPTHQNAKANLSNLMHANKHYQPSNVQEALQLLSQTVINRPVLASSPTNEDDDQIDLACTNGALSPKDKTNQKAMDHLKVLQQANKNYTPTSMNDALYMALSNLRSS